MFNVTWHAMYDHMIYDISYVNRSGWRTVDMNHGTGIERRVRNEVFTEKFLSFLYLVSIAANWWTLTSMNRGNSLQWLSVGFSEMDPFSHGIACWPSKITMLLSSRCVPPYEHKMVLFVCTLVSCICLILMHSILML